MRRKPLAALKTNVRELPKQIGLWKHSGRLAEAERAQRILEESRAELARREKARAA